MRTRLVPKRRSLLDAFRDVAGDGPAQQIARAFELMEVAEEEILRAMRERRDDPAALRYVWNAFPTLRPRVPIGAALYRVHVRELLERAAVRKGADLRPGTKAEVLLAISTATLASRLDRDVENLALSIAAEVWPEKAEEFAPGAEGYSGRYAELLHEFRRKCSVDDRTMPEEIREVPAHAMEKLRAA